MTPLRTPSRRRSRPIVRSALATLLAAAAAVPLAVATRSDTAIAAAQRPVFTMYVPLEEHDISDALFTMYTGGTPADNIVTTIGITAAADETILYYDHWEDGYEADIAEPAQATTEVWGDGDVDNGAPPSCASDACDAFDAGAVATLTSNVLLPRNPAQIRYDGRDKVAATRGVAVTRAAWDNTLGVVHGGAVATTDLSKYGTRFSIPVGVDHLPSFPNPNYATSSSANQTDPFEYAAASIMASQDDTVVQIDFDGDGSWDTAVPLDEGESYFTADGSYAPFEGLRTGARIVSSHPVQVHLMTGDVNHNYESRWFEIFPDELLDSEYVAPVSTTVTARPAVVWMHNPNPFPIDIEIDVAAPNPDVTLTAAPSETVEYTLPLGSGAHIASADGRFAAVAGIDPYSSTSASYDWGYSLVPVQALTPGVVIGWAPGKPAPYNATYSPVWVTPIADTDILVDFDGNGTVDETYTDIAAYEVVRISDPNDHQMTGARISTPDDTLIAAAYGQDTQTGQATAAYDLGITVLPTTTLVATKTARLHTDLDGNGELTPGDVVEYTIELIDAGALAITSLVASDPLPSELQYVPGTATHNGVAVPDDTTGSTGFPLDEWGVSIPLVAPGGIETFTYRTVVDANLAPSGDNIRNTVFVESDQADVTATANINVWFPDLYATKTASTQGPLLPGETFDWIVTTTNTGSSPQTDVHISDTLPDHVTLLDAEVTYTEFDPSLSVDATEDWSSFTYGSDPAVWNGNWQESDMSANATAGNVRIVSIDGSERLEINRNAGSGTSQHWIQRAIDTSNAVAGTVSFAYRPISLDAATDLVAFQVSTDNGATWTALDLWWGPLNEATPNYVPVTYSLDRHLGDDLLFRFWANFGGTGSNDSFYVDDFRVELPARSAETVPAAAAPDFTDGMDIDLFEDESVTLRLRVQVDSPLPADVFALANTAYVRSAEVPGPTPASSTLDVKPVSVGDLVWEDVDGDGIRDVGEPGVAGVGVQLAGTDALGQSVTVTTATNATGAYLFGGLPPGTYTASLDSLPAGYELWRDADGTHDNAISTGSSEWGLEFLTADFALVRPTTIGGNVFRDLDTDGTLDGGEPPIGGVTVALTGTDGLGNPVSTSTAVAPDGSYGFSGLRPGSYTVTVVTASAPQPSTLTTPGAIPVTITSGTPVAGVDFGFDVPTGVEITKTTNGTGMVVSGGAATFTIRVTNTGTGALTDVQVTDPLAPTCDRTIASLPPDTGAGDPYEEYSCTAAGWSSTSNQANVTATDEWGATVTDDATTGVTLIAPSIDVTIMTPTPEVVVNGAATFTIRVTNTGDVALTAAYVTTALPDDCDVTGLTLAAPTGDPAQTDHYHEYTCQLTGVTAAVTNVATAGGLDPNAEPVAPADDATGVTVLHPSLAITKGPADQQVRIGNDATFTITVTNDGETPLTGVGVADPSTPDCAWTIGNLAVGAVATRTCTHTGVGGAFTNEATATGLDPIGNAVGPVSATAGVSIIAPQVDIQVNPSSQTVPLDGTATFEIVVTNTGGSPLSNVTVTSGVAPCDLAIGALTFPGSHTYTCVLDDVAADTTVSATVTADDVNGDAVTPDVDDADVVVSMPSFTVVKQTVVPGPFALGADVEFEITVTNTSLTPLTDLVVSDPLTPDCNRTIAGLGAAPASTSFTCTASDVTADFTNVVTATAVDPLGDPVGPVSGSAAVDVLTPSIAIDKQAAGATVEFGGSIQWTITVTNDGEADLHGVAVTDALEPTCADVIAFLPAGAGPVGTVSWTCTTDGVTAGVTNTAEVTATDGAGNGVTGDAEATVAVGDPAFLAGRVWEDLNGNGVQDGGELGLIGVTVTFHDAGGNQVGFTTTDAHGLYQSDPLPPGDYSVRVHPPASTAVTARHIGTDPTADSDVDDAGAGDQTTLAAGGTTRFDAGLYRPAGLGDQVWFDDDLDGVLDPDESPATALTVTVVWHGPDGVPGTADDEIHNLVTDSAGKWFIAAARPGTWTITVANPDDWQSSPVTVDLTSGSANLDGDIALRAVPAITVASFAPVCVADIPYVDYTITVVGTLNTTATVTFTDIDGNVAQVLTGLPLTGRVLYPGASEAPDWPGWKLEGGEWVTDPTDARWRDGLDVTVEVNPTATTSVSYPPATAACNNPQADADTTSSTPGGNPSVVVPGGSPQGQTAPTGDATARTRASLPSTGADTGLAIATAFALCGAGLLLWLTARRRTTPGGRLS